MILPIVATSRYAEPIEYGAHNMTQNQINHYFHRRFTPVADRFPRLTRWLSARLSTDHFTDLPLTGLAVLLVVSIMTLSEVAENIVNAEPMVQVDHWFTQVLFTARTSGMSQFFYGITWFGSFYATAAAMLLGTVVLWQQHKRRNVFILWLLILGVSGMVQAGKHTFGRDRPVQVAYYPEKGYSFPSGHSATAMTLYGLLGYWFVRSRYGKRNRVLISLAAVSLILAVGFSRIYLGVHFLSDVLGGYLLGICWLIVGISLTEWQRTTNP